jgi:hypothetical protein
MDGQIRANVSSAIACGAFTTLIFAITRAGALSGFWAS